MKFQDFPILCELEKENYSKLRSKKYQACEIHYASNTTCDETHRYVVKLLFIEKTDFRVDSGNSGRSVFNHKSISVRFYISSLPTLNKFTGKFTSIHRILHPKNFVAWKSHWTDQNIRFKQGYFRNSLCAISWYNVISTYRIQRRKRWKKAIKKVQRLCERVNWFLVIEDLSRFTKYSNAFCTHWLGLAKIYEKINKGESGVRRSKEK